MGGAPPITPIFGHFSFINETLIKIIFSGLLIQAAGSEFGSRLISSVLMRW